MSFKVGDVCVIVGSSPGREHFVGREVVIASELRLVGVFDGLGNKLPPEPRHRVEADWLKNEKTFSTTRFWSYKPGYLRLKRPPSDDKQEPRADFTPGEWDLCPWKPTQVKA